MPPAPTLPLYKLLIIGSQDKSLLMDRLYSVSSKVETHDLYKDLHFITINSNGHDCFVEIVDPGLERTGQRDMAIRTAEAAILVYSPSEIDSFHELAGVVQEFRLVRAEKHKEIPIVLIANVDRNAYMMRPRRNSVISTEQGQQLAKLFGTTCVFNETSIPSMHQSKELIDRIIKAINESHPEKLASNKKVDKKEKKWKKGNKLKEEKAPGSKGTTASDAARKPNDEKRRKFTLSCTLL